MSCIYYNTKLKLYKLIFFSASLDLDLFYTTPQPLNSNGVLPFSIFKKNNPVFFIIFQNILKKVYSHGYFQRY